MLNLHVPGDMNASLDNLHKEFQNGICDDAHTSVSKLERNSDADFGRCERRAC